MAFWVNVGEKVALVHNSKCGQCLMDGKGEQVIDANRKNWWGPYATLGAAIDGAHQADRTLRGGGCCVAELALTRPYKPDESGG